MQRTIIQRELFWSSLSAAAASSRIPRAIQVHVVIRNGLLKGFCWDNISPHLPSSPPPASTIPSAACIAYAHANFQQALAATWLLNATRQGVVLGRLVVDSMNSGAGNYYCYYYGWVDQRMVLMLLGTERRQHFRVQRTSLFYKFDGEMKKNVSNMGKAHFWKYLKGEVKLGS